MSESTESTESAAETSTETEPVLLQPVEVTFTEAVDPSSGPAVPVPDEESTPAAASGEEGTGDEEPPQAEPDPDTPEEAAA
ncbi:hypothetical protein AB0D78_07900 [Streptomyces avermitilis]|uniref:hypothetical protein n=1 Tax=Streptomyces avermitilis TaxID=33903 RepID=UPI0033B032F8